VKILVVGGGGREHALAWRLSHTATVFCAPGNPGTATCATNLPIGPDDPRALIGAIAHHRIDLSVIGPEAPLAAGLADALRAAGRTVFGPSAAAARIESSKAFAKEIMARAGVPTAASRSFTDPTSATSFIREHAEPLVVKASGLAAGKGAVVCATREEAEHAAREILGGRFGRAGETVLVEDFLPGEELSVFAMTDGEHVMVLPPAQDHKRLLEQDLGPNTGGMGAYAPVSMGTPELLRRITDEVIRPTLRTLADTGAPYTGFLYAGLMIGPEGGPGVVEFNCRFGDPEAQVVLPLIGDDFAEHLWKIAAGEAWRPPPDPLPADGAAVTTVLAAPGYPDAPRTGLPVTVPATLPEHTLLFHAGTRLDGDRLVSAGGRVLCATGLGPDVATAARASRALAALVEMEGVQYRRDIAWREMERATGNRT